MANSLLVNGLELIGTDVNPEYRLSKGMSGGDITPDTVTLASLTLDGDPITGQRTLNKTWQFTVEVGAFTAGAPDRFALSGFVDRLLAATAADSIDDMPVVWTPDGCPSTTFTAFRATATPVKDMVRQDQGYAQIQLSFSTLPFGESAGLQTIDVAASGAAGPLQVDGMNSGSFTNATRDTSIKYEGASSARITLTKSSYTLAGTTYFRYDTPPTAPGRAISSTDLSGYGSMSVRFRWPAPAAFNGILSNVIVTLLLTSAGGRRSYVSTPLGVAKGSKAQQLVRFNLADLTVLSGGGVDLTAVTGWNAGVAANGTTDTGLASTSDCWVDDLEGYPPGSVGNATAEGSVLTIPALKGSARTPVQIAATHAGGLDNVLLHSPPASQDPDATILAGLSGGSVTIPAANMVYDDTFSVVLFFTATATAARDITVTFTQKVGATTIGVTTLTRHVSGAQTLLAMGTLITLPLLKQPAENTDGSLIIDVTSTDGSDVIADVALCSTSGQTIMMRGAVSATAVYVDLPDPRSGLGTVYASATDRTEAFSAMKQLDAYQGPIQFEPGDNRLLAASTAGAPDIEVAYTPRWLDEAQV